MGASSVVDLRSDNCYRNQDLGVSNQKSVRNTDDVTDQETVPVLYAKLTRTITILTVIARTTTILTVIAQTITILTVIARKVGIE